MPGRGSYRVQREPSTLTRIVGQSVPYVIFARQTDGVDKRPARSAGEQAAVIALRQVGVPYRYGGSTARGFDCSGLTQFAYAKAGVRIPRTTAAQWSDLSPVLADNLRVGDVLFFRIGGKISHVGLYLGRNRFVHAPSSGRKVSVEDLDSDFYRTRLIRGGRPK